MHTGRGRRDAAGGGRERAPWLRAYRDYRGLFDSWGYWAPGKGSRVEVAFVLRKGDALVAVEVRSGEKLFEADLRGLRAIADLKGVVRRVAVFRGVRRQRTADGIDILPVKHFVAAVEEGSLFP